MAYKDIVPVGTALIIGATSFGLGVIYAQWPYDINTLWRFDEGGLAAQRSLLHYATWGNAPMYIHHTFHGVIFLGLCGCFIKLYKPIDDAKYFEYGSLGLMMLAIVIYLSNIRIGVNSTLTGEWGEVDMATGINVMAASQVMCVVALVGVLFLQGGLYYAQWYDARAQAAFYKEEAEREAKLNASVPEAETTEATAEATGAAPKATKAKKKKRT